MFKVAARRAAPLPRHRRPKTFYEDGSAGACRATRSRNAEAAAVPPVDRATPGTTTPEFSLTGVPAEQRQNLASFMSVNSEATSEQLRHDADPGLPSNTQVRVRARSRTTSDRQGHPGALPFQPAKEAASCGNLLTLPVGDGLLYVQPVYTLRISGEGRYPALRLQVLRPRRRDPDGELLHLRLQRRRGRRRVCTALSVTCVQRLHH